MLQKIVRREIFCKSVLVKTGIKGFEYCINPYTGCSHACHYCYASFMCRFSGHQERWGSFVDIKVNSADILLKQLKGRKKPNGKVLIGTVTDAYQPDEAEYGITRSILEILADYRMLEVHILTKSNLVRRDISVLKRLDNCKVGFTITTMNPRIARIMEPGAPPPQMRISAAEELIKSGIPVWVFIAPIIPGITDTEESLSTLFHTLHEAGICEIMTDYLNPYPAVVRRLKNVYRRFFPNSLPMLDEYLIQPEIYRNSIKNRLEKYLGK
ncbi:MAG: radical SAM protein [Clostridiales bacterium]|nr:radical SAM protein [Clostridiales bacterium]